MRVVSLLPSATEILYELGVEPVGVSAGCDHPPAAREVPRMTRIGIDPDGSTAELNDRLDDAADLHAIDEDALREADPDLIVTQDVCATCAVDRGLVEETVERLGLETEVVTTDPGSLDDVFSDVERIGRALGRPGRAREAVSGFRERVAAVERRVAGVAERPRVVVLDWLDPVMVAGGWIPGMVERAGGRYGMVEPGEPAGRREWAAVREYDPEVIVLAPCGFGVERTVEDAPTLTDSPGWNDLPAVREGRVYAMDGRGHVNRPGPRLVETLEYLAGVIHPEGFEAPPRRIARPLASTPASRGP